MPVRFRVSVYYPGKIDPVEFESPSMWCITDYVHSVLIGKKHIDKIEITPIEE